MNCLLISNNFEFRLDFQVKILKLVLTFVWIFLKNLLSWINQKNSLANFNSTFETVQQ